MPYWWPLFWVSLSVIPSLNRFNACRDFLLHLTWTESKFRQKQDAGRVEQSATDLFSDPDPEPKKKDDMKDEKIKIKDAFYKLNSDNKIELHFEDKSTYQNLSSDVKEAIKKGFIWGRKRGAWVSRSKGTGVPFSMRKYDIEFKGADDLLNFQEIEERSVQRKSNKADRIRSRAEKKQKKADDLQAEFKKLSQDWSWVTQPNVNTSGGRAFSRSRKRVTDRFGKGVKMRMDAYKLEDYADVLDKQANSDKLKSERYLLNRMEEGKKAEKAFNKFVKTYADKIENIEDQPQDFKIWLMARLRDHKLAQQKYGYYKYHLTKLQESQKEKGTSTVDDVEARLKGFSKEIKDYFTNKHGLTVKSASKAFGKGRETHYLIRIKESESFPEKFQSGFAAPYVTQLSFAELAKHIDESKPEKEAPTISDEVTKKSNEPGTEKTNLVAASKKIRHFINEKFGKAYSVRTVRNTRSRSNAHILIERKDKKPLPDDIKAWLINHLGHDKTVKGYGAIIYVGEVKKILEAIPKKEPKEPVKISLIDENFKVNADRGGVVAAFLEKEDEAKEANKGKKMSASERANSLKRIRTMVKQAEEKPGELSMKQVIQIGRQINDQRSFFALFNDLEQDHEIRRWPTEKNLKIWAKNPGKSDLLGVDSHKQTDATIGVNKGKDFFFWMLAVNK